MPKQHDLCRKCGKEANNECSGCKGAFYCSKDCQRWDWKTGKHKVLCRGPEANRKIHIILRELFAAEYEWLKNLTVGEKERLFYEDTRDHKLNHLFISGEVALVLARGVPCMVPFNSQLHTPSFTQDYVVGILVPWWTRHKSFLSEHGFALDVITHGLYVAEVPCPCIDSCGELADIVAGESHGTVLIISDRRSPDYELVRNVFLTKRPKKLEEWSDEEKKVTINDFLQCISFRPSLAMEGGLETRSPVYYAFVFPSFQVFGGEEVCCSAALKLRFSPDAKDATALGSHFRKCYHAMEAIGFLVELDVIVPENWPDEDFAKMLAAAAGSMENIIQQNGHVAICFRMDNERREHIFNLLEEMVLAAHGSP